MDNIKEREKNCFSEKVGSLHLYINLILGKYSKKVVGITSAERKLSKSEIAFELSKSFAKSNKKVLLIDGDERHSRMSEICGIENKYVFFDILNNDGMNYRSVINKYNDNLDILFLGDEEKYSLRMNSINKMSSIFQSIINMYDYIIIDLETINDEDQSKKFIMKLDGLFLVTVMDDTNNYIAKTKRKVDKYGCKLLGVVFDKYRLN